MKDSTQLRGGHQAMIQWANSNNEKFPTPSDVDRDGFTLDVGQRGDPRNALRLDSSGNIFSLLVWNGSVPTQRLVSPAEAGPIENFENDMTSSPDSAAVPARALWDPSLRAHPGDAVLSGRETPASARWSA